MKANVATICFIRILLSGFLPQSCEASFFDMALKEDSIYTPGKLKLSLKLTNETKIKGNYKFQVSIFTADILTRKQSMAVTADKPAVFELMFPKVRNKTDVRCRTELFIDEQFVEAKEKPLALWPCLETDPKEFMDKVIWSFDTSGRLQNIFEDFGIESIDATFQPVRDFGMPDIVFVGENLPPNNMQIIINRLALVESKPVVVFLKQEQLPHVLDAKIYKENNNIKRIACDMNSPLLEGLNKLDIISLLNDSVYVSIKEQKNRNRSFSSIVSVEVKDKEEIGSYLLTIKKEGQIIMYCQLPLADGKDPRCGILFKNVLEFANRISNLKNNSPL